MSDAPGHPAALMVGRTVGYALRGRGSGWVVTNAPYPFLFHRSKGA
jgi:hypothetical protein